MIPAALVRKTHKLRKQLKWVYLKEVSQLNMHYHWMFLLGNADAKADKDIEFVLLSNNPDLDSIVKRLNEGGRKCIRIPLEEPKPQPEKLPELELAPLPLVQETLELPKNEEIANNLRPDPKPAREGAAHQDEADTVLTTAKETLEKLQSTGQRPENLETLKHYIHLFSTNPGNRRVSIDQILDYMEAQREISIHQGLVTYNF